MNEEINVRIYSNIYKKMNDYMGFLLMGMNEKDCVSPCAEHCGCVLRSNITKANEVCVIN